MFGKTRKSICLENKEPLVHLNNEDISNVSGGVVIDNGTHYLVINTSGMGVVMSKVYYGKPGQLNQVEAGIRANYLDSIDYSVT